MNDPAIKLSWSKVVYDLAALIRTLPAAPPLFLVGGAVRDAYLRRSLGDIDIAVDGSAIASARFVADAWKADIYIMDRERDVARVFLKQGDRLVTIDFARLRGSTLEEDLQDRDFSMNAMAADLLLDPTALIDPLNGKSDLRQKILRRCSPRSIANDPIRALRAVRLSAQFDLKIHPDTAADIRQQASALRQTSPERVRDEFFKLLGMEKAARGLRVLAHLGILRHILPLEAESLALSLPVVERLAALLTAISNRRSDNTAAAFDLGMLVIQLDQFRGSLQAHLSQAYGNSRRHAELLTLAALLHNLGDAAAPARGSISTEHVAAAARSLRLSKDESRHLSAAVAHCRALIEGEFSHRLEQHRFWHQLGAGGIDVILLGAAIEMASAGSKLKQTEWLRFVDRASNLLEAYFKRFDTIVNPTLLLDGNEVQRLLGIGRGPQIGQMLTILREAQVAGEITSVDEAREFLAGMAEA